MGFIKLPLLYHVERKCIIDIETLSEDNNKYCQIHYQKERAIMWTWFELISILVLGKVWVWRGRERGREEGERDRECVSE